ncbi:MAG TPA: glycosyltransferase family 2 protein [Flavobacterium sp.]
MPKISIITINYNNLVGLKRTVDSVVNQTWQEFEYIVIDGGSTDDSATYIESQSEHIDYWVSEPDKGIYNAMNKGIAKATGEYLLFLNSGDHLYDYEVLKNGFHYLSNFDLISFDMIVVGENKNKLFFIPKELRFSDLFFHTLPHPSTFIKKKLFDYVGLYDENLKIVSDWKFFILALFKFKCSYVKVNEILSCFYTGGISSQIDYSEERVQVIAEYFSEHRLDCEELFVNRNLIQSNRFKMLTEIETTIVGKKIISIFFRLYLFFFSRKKINEILKHTHTNLNNTI